MSDDRIICTKEQPAKNDGRRYAHPDAEHVGECWEGCCDKYKCPNCGIRFAVEAPQ